jgi:predicted PhzF superfamily epimerase YddE/YHI9
VRKCQDTFVLDFPRLLLQPCQAPQALLKGLEVQPGQVLKTVQDPNYYAIFDTEKEILTIKPNLRHLEQLHPFGVVVTAPGETSDFVSRFFAPGYGIPEDPVTGSIHCGLIPYWSKRLGKNRLLARQVSQRGGELYCELLDERVSIGGKAALYLEGTIYIGKRRGDCRECQRTNKNSRRI